MWLKFFFVIYLQFLVSFIYLVIDYQRRKQIFFKYHLIYFCVFGGELTLNISFLKVDKVLIESSYFTVLC